MADSYAGRWHLTRFFSLAQPQAEQPHVRSLLTGHVLPFEALTQRLLAALAVRPLTLFELASQLGLQNAEVAEQLDRLWEARLVLRTPDTSLEVVWRSLNERLSASPHVDFVEITNVCQGRCVMCNVGLGLHHRPRGFIEPQLFERIVSQLGSDPGRTPLTLHNSGEPLLHPQLTELIAIARRGGVKTEISTNPGLLDLPGYRALRDAGLDRLILALDATDPTTLRTIRGAGVRPERAFENLDAIITDRAAAADSAPEILVQFVQLSLNAHQQEAFLARYGRLGLPGVTAFVKPLEAPANSPLFIAGATPERFFCTAPWSSIGVLWDGRVVPCCYDANATTVLGDLSTQSLTEVWKSDQVARLRERIRTDRCERGELCHECPNRPDRYARPSLEAVSEKPRDWVR